MEEWIRIIFNGLIENSSLQIGDTAYFVTPGTSIAGSNGSINQSQEEPKIIGVITKIIKNTEGYVTEIRVNNPINLPSDDDFIMFQKNKAANNTSLLGYYAEVKLTNNAEDSAELYSLSSEIAPSSK
tara:strand:- start:1 stop:381 length:381 start_codon:yes stop_codon:yes gene_type:complete